MRFVCEFKSPFGITFPRALAVMRPPSGNREEISAEVDVWVSEEACGSAPPIWQRAIAFTPELGEGAVPVTEQAAALFMALPEFIDPEIVPDPEPEDSHEAEAAAAEAAAVEAEAASGTSDVA